MKYDMWACNHGKHSRRTATISDDQRVSVCVCVGFVVTNNNESANICNSVAPNYIIFERRCVCYSSKLLTPYDMENLSQRWL